MLFPCLFPTVRHKDPVDTFSGAQSREAVLPCAAKATCSNYSSSICITQMSQACILETNTWWQSPGLVLLHIFQVYLGSSCCPKGHQTGAAESKEYGFPVWRAACMGCAPVWDTPHPAESNSTVHPSLKIDSIPRSSQCISENGKQVKKEPTNQCTHPLSPE